MTNGEINQPNENSEPLLVGTNITFDYDTSENDGNIAYATDSQPLGVGTNLTIEISYSEAEALEELGISLDGSDNYLGSNIAVIDGERDWLDRIDGNPLYSGGMTSANDSYSWDFNDGADNPPESNGNGETSGMDFDSNGEEPLLVGTNITFVIKEDETTTDGESEVSEDSNDDSSPSREGDLPFALGTNLLLELSDSDSEEDSYLGNNLSTIEEGSQTSDMEGDSSTGGMIPAGFGNQFGGDVGGDSFTGGMMGDMEGNPFSGGMMPGGEGNQPTNDNEDYAWDFSGQLDRFSADDSNGMGGTDLDALYQASPWGSLTEVGLDSFEDVFPNVPNDPNSNPFAGFGGDESMG